MYQHILELRIATPQVILNYASLLEEKHFFEEAFTVYERGIAMFKWPIVYELWNVYLVKFTQRFGGRKLERTRELFEQAVTGCDPQFAKPLFLLYASFEEEHGLARHAMHIYERAAAAVPVAERLEVWRLYIARAGAVFGVTHTRELYEQAIAALPDASARDVALEFADLERKLGEIDRARAVYAYAAQFCDPRVTSNTFWRVWNDFEVNHGNEDTFREMLRVNRSITATYSTSVNFAAVQQAGTIAAGPKLTAAATASSMAALEAEAAERSRTGVISGFVKATSAATGASAAPAAASSAPANRDEIALDSDDDDDDSDGGSDADSNGDGEGTTGADGDSGEPKKKKAKEMPITTKVVPASVFGGVTEEALGARARFRAKKAEQAQQ